MNKLAYILIPAVLAFGLFFGLARSGAHDAIFGGMNMQKAHAACEGAWCGLLPDLTCSVHCLTAGLLQSLDQPVAGVVPVMPLLFFAVTIIAAVALVGRRMPLAMISGLSPPGETILTVIKRE